MKLNKNVSLNSTDRHLILKRTHVFRFDSHSLHYAQHSHSGVIALISLFRQACLADVNITSHVMQLDCGRICLEGEFALPNNRITL